MTEIVLKTTVGDHKSLPIILLAQYLKQNINLDVVKSAKENCGKISCDLPALCIGSENCIETPAAILRYLARENSSSTYPES